MRDKIYLIGQISVDEPKTYQWRKNVEEYFEESEQFETINPCRNEFNRASLNEYKGKDINRLKIYKSSNIDIIVPKDKMYVKKSTIAIANMNQYDKEKPLIGTCFELAWYHDNNHKTVIGIYDGDTKNSIWCNHPFIRNTIHAWVSNEYEACELINKYIKH